VTASVLIADLDRFNILLTESPISEFNWSDIPNFGGAFSSIVSAVVVVGGCCCCAAA